MPWIKNIPLSDIKTGQYIRCTTQPENTILIQIVDPGYEFPTPKVPLKAIYQYNFLDIEDTSLDQNLLEFKISIKQAQEIAKILTQSLAENTNILVHCHQGLCRSGAVAEVGIMLGFEDTGTRRQPNITVKKALMLELGLEYGSAFRNTQKIF